VRLVQYAAELYVTPSVHSYGIEFSHDNCRQLASRRRTFALDSRLTVVLIMQLRTTS